MSRDGVMKFQNGKKKEYIKVIDIEDVTNNSAYFIKGLKRVDLKDIKRNGENLYIMHLRKVKENGEDLISQDYLIGVITRHILQFDDENGGITGIDRNWLTYVYPIDYALNMKFFLNQTEFNEDSIVNIIEETLKQKQRKELPDLEENAKKRYDICMKY